MNSCLILIIQTADNEDEPKAAPAHNAHQRNRRLSNAEIVLTVSDVE